MITEQKIAVGPLFCQASRDSVKKMALPYLTEQYGWDPPNNATYFCFGLTSDGGLVAGWMDDGGSYFRHNGYRIVSPDDPDLADWFKRRGWEKKPEWESIDKIGDIEFRANPGEIVFTLMGCSVSLTSDRHLATLRRALDIAAPQPQGEDIVQRQARKELIEERERETRRLEECRDDNRRLRAEVERLKSENTILREGLLEVKAFVNHRLGVK
jgi:hypothetical protein